MLGDAQPQRIHGERTESVDRLPEAGEQPSALFLRKGNWQARLARQPDFLRREEWPVEVQATIEEELQPVRVRDEGAPGQARLFGQPEDVLVDLLFGDIAIPPSRRLFMGY